MNKIKENLWMILLGLLFVLGFIFLSVKGSERYREEIAEKREQEKQEEQVYKAMNLYVKELSRILRDDGIEDIEIVWTEHTSEEYAEKYGFTPSYCEYFFSLDYYSDEIANICGNYLNKGEEEALIVLLEKCCQDKQSYAALDEERLRRVSLDDGAIDMCINDGVNKEQLLFKTSDGQKYFVDANEIGTWVFKNGKHLVNRINPVPEYKQEATFTYIPSNKKKKHNTDKYTGPYYDPYGVEDYDDPDAFAEEWAEEFGDGDYDDGYDDAYAYWEEEY